MACREGNIPTEENEVAESHKTATVLQPCPIAKLYGQWSLIRIYSGLISSIDTLTKIPPINMRYGTPTQTYNKDGTFVSDEGDYKDHGNFIIVEKDCSIKEVNVNSRTDDSTTLYIAYLDNEYLILTKGSERIDSWFYRRK